MRLTRSFAALFVLAFAVPACGRNERSTPLPSTSASVAEPALPLAWCGAGYLALDDGACLALPDRFATPASLVVYAHGMIAPDAVPAEEQATLLAAARAHGFALLFPRGKAGLCAWDPSVDEHRCWPTKQEVVDTAGPAILAEWNRAQARAEAIAGAPFARRYLFGFSNGGYFAAFLSVEGRYRIDGVGVVGAGRSAVDESLSGAARPPLYLAVGDQEADVTRQDASNLAEVLKRTGWSVDYVVHAGRGHELREDDLAAAWAAWGR